MRKVLEAFSVLADGDIDWMVKVGAKRRLEPGSRVLTQGQTSDSMFVLLDGSLRVVVEQPVRRVLTTLGCGEMLGELSFLDRRPPTASVEAIERATVLAIPKASIEKKLLDDLGFASRFYHSIGVILAQRLRRNTETHGEGQSLSDDVHYDEELDVDELDAVAVAGARFDWVLKRLGGN